MSFADERITVTNRSKLIEFPFVIQKSVHYRSEKDLVMEGSIQGATGIDSILSYEEGYLISNSDKIYQITTVADQGKTIFYDSNLDINNVLFKTGDGIFALFARDNDIFYNDKNNPWSFVLYQYKNNNWIKALEPISMSDYYGSDDPNLDWWSNDAVITTLIDGRVVFLFDKKNVSILDHSTNTFSRTALNLNENLFDSIYYIDKYGYQYVELYNKETDSCTNIILDITGKYICDLIIPETGFPTHPLIGDSDNFLYSFSSVYNEDKSEKYKHGGTDYEELYVNLYKIKRNPINWELEFAGKAFLTEMKASGADGLILDWPLDHYFEISNASQHNTWLDEEGNLYYYELSNATGENKVSIMKVTLDVDTKIIDWARDGITEYQFSHFDENEISWYLDHATKKELRLFRNALFALHHYQFNSEDLTEYFSRF